MNLLVEIARRKIKEAIPNCLRDNGSIDLVKMRDATKIPPSSLHWHLALIEKDSREPFPPWRKHDVLALEDRTPPSAADMANGKSRRAMDPRYAAHEPWPEGRPETWPAQVACRYYIAEIRRIKRRKWA